MKDFYDSIEIGGTQFNVYLFPDDTDPPWENSDYMPVSEWTTRAKRPGEMVIATDRSYKRYYDFQEACRVLRAGDLSHKHAADAAMFGYNRLRQWCDGYWCYVGIQVVLCDDVGDEIEGESEILGGIESDDKDYIMQTAHELAREILARLETFA